MTNQNNQTLDIIIESDKKYNRKFRGLRTGMEKRR